MYINETTFNSHPETTSTQKEMDAYLFLEENVLKEEYFACHPMVNTATVKFKTEDLINKILPALNREYTLVNLECEDDE